MKTNKLTALTGLLTSWRWPWIVFTLLVFAALIKLSVWQSDRADEKQIRLERITALNTQQAIDLTTVLMQAKSEDLNSINDLPVTLNGEFNNQLQFLLDNQTNHGRLGYKALQVFFDQSSGKHVLINLGWLEGSIDRKIIPSVNDIIGVKNISGNIRIIEQGIVLAEEELQGKSWPVRIQRIDLEKISQLINIELLPFVVFLDKNEQLGYKKNWQPVVMPPEKHRGYAFQWLTLAIAWLSLMIAASYKMHKQRINQ